MVMAKILKIYRDEKPIDPTQASILPNMSHKSILIVYVCYVCMYQYVIRPVHIRKNGDFNPIMGQDTLEW